MAETATIQNVYDEVKSLKKELVFIKEHMVDQDIIIGFDEERRFKRAMKELKEGKTKNLVQVKKELGI